MIILGIETSCDETAVAVLTKQGNRITILSNVVASSAKLQAKYGGVIPEQAAREQIKVIIPVIEEAINDSRLTINEIDAIAVTYGPGLIGSLLVGVETAKTLAIVWGKPLTPINHLLGHFYANWINNHPTFPCVGLLVSGGHTDLVLFEDHGKYKQSLKPGEPGYKYLGGTRDDAAGECFDKCARLLGLPYPGGPHIAKLAQKGNPKAVDLPRPMIDSDDFDFSFSGLKTAVSRVGDDKLADLAASIEQTIVDVLVAKTIKAAKLYKIKQIMIAGGVAANQKLKEDLRFKINDLRLKIKLHIPEPQLCTDNGAMIAAAGFFTKPISNPLNLQADPTLSLLY